MNKIIKYLSLQIVGMALLLGFVSCSDRNSPSLPPTPTSEVSKHSTPSLSLNVGTNLVVTGVTEQKLPKAKTKKSKISVTKTVNWRGWNAYRQILLHVSFWKDGKGGCKFDNSAGCSLRQPANYDYA